MEIRIPIPVWNIEAETGYVPITTFWQDFSMAEKFGGKAVRDTFKDAFLGWRKNYKYLTELVMVLNHKIWQHYDPDKDSPMARLYNELWMEADNWAYENLVGEELEYYLTTLD